MAGEISGVTSKVPSAIDQMSDMTKGLGLSEKTTQTIKDVAAIISSRSVNVTSNVNSTNETGRPTGATNIPALDNPADIKQLEENLEKLISYLQMDNEERQAQMAKDRINLQKDALETERQGRSEKIEKSLKDMDKAAESRKASKIFGWLMTALAVVAAVVACVATGGLAVGPVIGAGIAVACQVLSATGAMDKIVESLAKGLEDLGMSKQTAQIVAQVLITAAIMAASIGAGFGGGAVKLVEVPEKIIAAMEKIRAVVTIGTLAVGIGGTIAGGVAGYHGYEAGLSQADVSETNKFITALQQRLSECEEELEQILQQLQNVLGQVAELLTSATNTSSEIANNLGQMA